MQKNPSVKILVAYHKPSALFKDEVLTPIHLGRALSKEAHKDGKMSDEDFEWLCQNMIGDDTGENISHLNRYFNEMTGIYWAWKNYDKLGNPDYIGLCHYRRHFIFDEYISNFISKKFVNYHPIIENITPRYRELISIENFIYFNNYDLILPTRFSTFKVGSNSIYDFFTSLHQDTKQLTEIEQVLTANQEFSEYSYLARNLTKKQKFYPCNVFIMKKALFFEYCEFIFKILLPLYDKNKEEIEHLNYWQKRNLGFCSEQLTSIFIERQILKGRQYKEFEVSYLENTEDCKFRDKIKLNALKKLISNHSIISFDLFDTLLVRPYAKPIDVFKHLEQHFKQKGFFDLRKKAEFEAMKNLNKKQVNFDEIYSQMPKKFQFLKDKEKELELRTLYVNPFCKELFDYAKSLNKTIILTSDMYHSSEFIEKILNKNDIKDYHKIYVSSEIGKTKHHKDLYEHILQDLKVEAREILHIGDNEFADFKNAKEVGLEAFYLENPAELFFKDFPKMRIFYDSQPNSLTASIVVGICLKKWLLENKELENYWQYFGYFYGGAICYGLSQWVYENAVKENLKEMIFIARDGYTIEKIFNLLQEHFKNNPITTHYVNASRNLCNVVNGLDFLSKEKLDYKVISLVANYKNEIQDFKNINDFDLACQVANHKNRKIYYDLIQKNKKQIESLLEQKLFLYKQYLERFKLKFKKIGIFDLVTSSFSVKKTFNKIFPTKTFIDFYWFVNSDSKCYKTYTYSNIFHQTTEYDIDEFLEFLITAPEFSANDINEDLSFTRKSNYFESLHIETYKTIAPMELEFSKTLLKTFGNFEVNFDYFALKKHIEVFQHSLDFEDKIQFFNYYKALDDAGLKYIKIMNIDKQDLYGAPLRVKNHLAYKLGSKMIKAKTFRNILVLPFALLSICANHIIYINIKKAQNLPPLEHYADYLESLKYKKHLSYRLGSAMLKNPFTFAFKVSQIYKEYKREK